MCFWSFPFRVGPNEYVSASVLGLHMPFRVGYFRFVVGPISGRFRVWIARASPGFWLVAVNKGLVVLIVAWKPVLLVL
jgi:hypothetical protein